MQHEDLVFLVYAYSRSKQVMSVIHSCVGAHSFIRLTAADDVDRGPVPIDAQNLLAGDAAYAIQARRALDGHGLFVGPCYHVACKEVGGMEGVTVPAQGFKNEKE
jgi:hypothetical protein